MLWHVSHMHFSLAQTEFTATVAQTHIGQHAVRSKTMQNSDNYLWDSQLMQPERRWIDGLSATERCRAIQYRRASIPCHSHNSHMRHLPSCLICTLPTQHPPCFSWRWHGWPARQM